MCHCTSLFHGHACIASVINDSTPTNPELHCSGYVVYEFLGCQEMFVEVKNDKLKMWWF